jgi:hypothetical protein
MTRILTGQIDRNMGFVSFHDAKPSFLVAA